MLLPGESAIGVVPVVPVPVAGPRLGVESEAMAFVVRGSAFVRDSLAQLVLGSRYISQINAFNSVDNHDAEGIHSFGLLCRVVCAGAESRAVCCVVQTGQTYFFCSEH